MQKLGKVLIVLSLSLVTLTSGGNEKDAPEVEKQLKPEKKGSRPVLFRAVFTVPPSFNQVSLAPENSKGPVDPFAAPENIRTRRVSAKEILESAGITFSEGASATYNSLTSTLTVVNTEDQLELVEAFVGGGCDLGPEKEIYIILEYIETNSALFQDWMFENRITTDGITLRKQVQQWVKDGKATIIESSIVTARSGQRAKTESIHEVIYPTEYDPVSIPNDLTLSGKDSVSPVSSTVGTAFETRKVGSTLEVDPVLGSDEFTIDLNLAPEIVQQKALLNWSPNKGNLLTTVTMPIFHKLKITTQVTTLHGRYAFLGAAPPLKAADPNRKKPIVLVFVRGDISKSPVYPEKKRTRYRRK